VKKLCFVFMLTCALGIWANAQDVQKPSEIIKYFVKTTLPFNTDDYSKIKSKELPYELTLKYFFRGNKTAAEYPEEIYSVDENQPAMAGNRKVLILPIHYFYQDSTLFTTYFRIDKEDDPAAFLSIWNSDDYQGDSLEVFFKPISTPEFSRWVRAKVTEEKVVVFRYTLNLQKDALAQNAITEIIVSHYWIDFTRRRFLLEKEELFRSKYYIFELYGASEPQIKNEDPFNRY